MIYISWVLYVPIHRQWWLTCYMGFKGGESLFPGAPAPPPSTNVWHNGTLLFTGQIAPSHPTLIKSYWWERWRHSKLMAPREGGCLSLFQNSHFLEPLGQLVGACSSPFQAVSGFPVLGSDVSPHAPPRHSSFSHSLCFSSFQYLFEWAISMVLLDNWFSVLTRSNQMFITLRPSWDPLLVWSRFQEWGLGQLTFLSWDSRGQRVTAFLWSGVCLLCFRGPLLPLARTPGTVVLGL